MNKENIIPEEFWEMMFRHKDKKQYDEWNKAEFVAELLRALSYEINPYEININS